jgi:hypothetical protein
MTTQSVDYNANNVLPASTTVATEQSLTFDPGLRTRVVMQMISTNAWYLRSGASGDNMPIAANTPYNVVFYGSVGPQTLYWARQTADGVLNMSIVE